MKKAYKAPVAEKIVFQYSEQVTASGGSTNSCYWQNNGFWTHGTQTCNDTYQEGTATQVPA